MTRAIACLAIFLLVGAIRAERPELSFESADARIRRVYALARETNDSSLVERVLELRDLVRRSFGRKDMAAAERLIRDAEESVGLDPGGKTMLGLPVASIEPAQQKKLDKLDVELAVAMKKEDRTAVKSIVAEMQKLLGNEAGLPDVRRRGESGKVIPRKPAEVAGIFVKVVEADPQALQVLSAGVPAASTQARAYSAVADACLTIRPLVEQDFKDKLKMLDELIGGCCKCMLALQLPDGHFRFPDLRGKNLVLGEAIDKIVDKDADAVKNGWLITAFPDGSCQVDAAECGMALLRAGREFKNNDWTHAGLKAADWSASFPAVPTFQFNAESVSLLCAAFQSSGDKKYRDAAVRRYELGIAPGQAATGRWIDPESARTSNHFAMIRALHDLFEILPPGPKRDPIAELGSRAVQIVLDEADKLGPPITSLTIRELNRHIRQTKSSNPALRKQLEIAASAAVQRCTPRGKFRAAVPLPELAAAATVWPR